jgi:hypothetical protein
MRSRSLLSVLLPHAVEVERLRLAVRPQLAEDLQRLVLRGRGEGKEADIGLLAALGHGLENLFLVVWQAFRFGLSSPLKKAS